MRVEAPSLKLVDELDEEIHLQMDRLESASREGEPEIREGLKELLREFLLSVPRSEN